MKKIIFILILVFSLKSTMCAESSFHETEVLVQMGANSYKVQDKFKSLTHLGAQSITTFNTNFFSFNPLIELSLGKMFGPVGNSNSYFFQSGLGLERTFFDKSLKLSGMMKLRFEKLGLYERNQEKSLWAYPAVELEYLALSQVSLILGAGNNSYLKLAPKFHFHIENVGHFITELSYEQIYHKVKRRSIMLKSGKSF